MSFLSMCGAVCVSIVGVNTSCHVMRSRGVRRTILLLPRGRPLRFGTPETPAVLLPGGLLNSCQCFSSDANGVQQTPVSHLVHTRAVFSLKVAVFACNNSSANLWATNL